MGIGAKSFSSANDISSPVSRDMMGFRDENTISIEAAPDFSKQSLVSVVSKQAYDSYQPAIAVNTEIFNNAVPDSYYIGVQGPRIATVTDTLNAAFGQSVRASTLGVSTKGGLTNAFNSSLFAVSFAYQATGFSKSTEQLAIESANLTAKAQTVFNSGKIDSSEFMKEAINSTPTETISYVSEALPFAEILTPAEVAAPVEFVSEPLNDIVTEPVVSVEVEPIQETVVESGLLVSIRAAVIVAEVNDAPIVSSSTNFTSITEDQTNHSGQFISDIVSITDADSGASSGIAVHTIDSGNGAWQYSLDSGSTWTAIINVSTSNALLLGSNDKLRFVPDGDNSDSGNVQFYGWDQTSGVAGATVDASTRGGSTAFSTDSDTSSITVTAVNDAPTISSSINFTTITEDQTSNAGNDVSDLASIADVDSGASSGIAVHTLDSSNGTWQYSTDSGSTWTAVGQVSESNALLLASTDKLRFVPDGNNADSADVDFYAWDQTSGAAGTKVDASTRGDTTAFSTGTENSSITVSAVNDAPTISSSSNFTAITEDATANAGNDVSDLVSISDVDSGASSGIAVHTVDSSNGIWQYSTDSGSSWIAVGQVSTSNALLLASTDKLRFVPDGNNADSADVDFYAWDQTSGTAGTKVDASTRGDTTAFSTGTENSSITVSAVNDAPTISSSSNFTTITEDQTTNAGNDVSDLASIADVDSGASSGIAVHTIDSSNGTWQYSTDSGSSWIAVGQVSTSNALLLASTDKLRFVPDGNNADSADVDFYAWDQTSGAAGTKVDASTRGDTTAFSTGTENSSITVSAVNDAPTISSSSNFTAITEDATANAGNDVSDLVSISDVDSGASSGIAVHTVDSSNGTWQYSTDSGSSWTAVGQVSTSNALLLSATDKLRFVPDGNNADSADVDFYAWDQTSGAAGTKVDASTRGDTTAFSSGTENSSISVSAVNDAPTISSSSNFTAITEDATTNAGNDVSDLASIADVDSGASSGIAVHTVDSSNGTWQYSTDSGSSWIAVGQVSTSNALLLTSTDKLRFVPDGNNADSADVDFYAWDQTSGAAGTKVDASTRGGTTAFSSGTENSSITVSAVNDAPTISSSSNFTAITEDATTNAGNDVSDLASIADVDSGASSGIAVHTVDSSNGTWQYSTDSGSSWIAVGQVSTSNALLLTSTDKLRFVPDGNNADSADVDFYAWDQTSGAAGTKVDASTRGGTTAFSSGTENSSITVSAVNDAPTISSSSNFTTITEDQTTNAGNDVSDLASIADVDSGASSGIAVHTIDSSNGTWQYSTDSGSSWTAVGQVSESNALLLASTDKLRFVPDGNNADSADVDFYAWDQTSGAAGTKVDASTRGDTTAFSSGTESSSITVSAVNDAPTISSSSDFTAITEDATTNAGNDVSDLASIADVDSGASSGIAVHTIDSSNGTWQYSTDSGSSWIAVGQVSTSNALLLSATDKLRFVPDGNNADSADIDFYAWDQTSGAAGTKADASTRGGSTAFSTGTENSSITVSAVNDAPSLTADTPDLTTITEDDTNNSGDTVANVLGNTLADVDTGASEGMAIYGSAITSGSGTWQYKVGNGSWTAMSNLAESAALLLAATDSIRFVPDGLNEAAGTLSYYGWDQTSDNAGDQVDVSTRGGTTAFSSDGDVASISVTEVGDTFVLTSGNDTVIGGSADDTIETTQANYNAGDAINGGGGANTFALQGGGQFTLENNISNIETVTVADGGTYTLTLTSITGLTTIDATALSGGNEITVDGSTYTATLIMSGGAGGNTLTGGSADDVIVGGAESDILTGGAGADTLTGNAGADELVGGDGADTLTGGEGSDELSGDAGADTLLGGADADTLTGGAGIDTLQGGAGDDTLIYDASSVDLLVDGGADTDTLAVASSANGVTIDLTVIADNVYTNIEVIDLTGSGGNNLTLFEADVLAINSSGVLTVDGDIDDYVALGNGWSLVSSADGYDRYEASLGVVLVNSQVSTDQQGGQGIDPIIIDLNGDGISLISHHDSQVRFDMTGDGQLNKTAWANAADAILAYDVNDNGFIDNIHELFSERFNGESYSNAVEALATFDVNQDNLIDANDLVYQDLVLWQDKNSDGISDEGELSSLADMGIEHIDLVVSPINIDVELSTILSEGAVQFNDGTTAVYNEASFYVSDVHVSDNNDVIENFIYEEQSSDAMFGEVYGNDLTAPDEDTLVLYNQQGELFSLKISTVTIAYSDILGNSDSAKLLSSLNSLDGDDSIGLHELNHPAFQLDASEADSFGELTDNNSFIVTDEMGNEYNLASGEFSAKDVVEINGETFVHYVNQQATESGSIDLYINNNHTAMLG